MKHIFWVKPSEFRGKNATNVFQTKLSPLRPTEGAPVQELVHGPTRTVARYPVPVMASLWAAAWSR